MHLRSIRIYSHPPKCSIRHASVRIEAAEEVDVVPFLDALSYQLLLLYDALVARARVIVGGLRAVPYGEQI